MMRGDGTLRLKVNPTEGLHPSVLEPIQSGMETGRLFRDRFSSNKPRCLRFIPKAIQLKWFFIWDPEPRYGVIQLPAIVTNNRLDVKVQAAVSPA